MELNKPIQLTGNETEEDLRKLKAQAYKLATDTGIISGLRLVADILGENQNAKYGPKYLFQHEDIEIYSDNYGHFMTVKKSGKLIVSTHNEKLFAPGEWLDTLIPFMEQARVKKAEREQQQQVTRTRELMAELSV